MVYPLLNLWIRPCCWTAMDGDMYFVHMELYSRFDLHDCLIVSWSKKSHILQIKTHGSVIQLKKWGACNTVSIFIGRRKLRSSHICNPMMSTSFRERHIPNLKKIPSRYEQSNFFISISSYFSSFRTLYKNPKLILQTSEHLLGVEMQIWAINLEQIR